MQAARISRPLGLLGTSEAGFTAHDAQPIAPRGLVWRWEEKAVEGGGVWRVLCIRRAANIASFVRSVPRDSSKGARVEGVRGRRGV